MIIRLDSFSKHIYFKYFGIFRLISVFQATAMLKFANSQQMLSSGSFCQIYRVTDEALIAETVVWPNLFLMNVFFALKGSKLFIFYYYFLCLFLLFLVRFWLLNVLFEI